MQLPWPPFTSRISPTTAKMGNSYNQDDNEAEIDKKIKTLQKHLEIAEKEATIAELENKKKKREEEWAVKKFGQHGLYSEHRYKQWVSLKLDRLFRGTFQHQFDHGSRAPGSLK